MNNKNSCNLQLGGTTMIDLYNRHYSSSLIDFNLKLKCGVVEGKKIRRIYLDLA